MNTNSRINSTVAWRTLLGLIIAVIIGITGWMLNEIYNFPVKYVCKEDYLRTTQRIESKIDKQTEEFKKEFKEIQARLDRFVYEQRKGKAQ